MYQLPSSYPDSSNFSYILYHAYVARMANTWWPLIPVLTNTAKWHRGHQLNYHMQKRHLSGSRRNLLSHFTKFGLGTMTYIYFYLHGLVQLKV